MLGFISGRILSVENESNKDYIRLVIGVNNNELGYVILIARDSCSTELSVKSEISLWLSNIFREDSNTLYGFQNDSDRKLFEQLITVSGIGPRIALAMFSIMRSPEIMEAIASDDITALSKTPGLGKKGASKIILDLKGKLISPETAENSADSDSANSGLFKNAPFDSLISALVNLGFKKDAAVRAAKNAVENVIKGEITDENLPNALKESLKLLRK